MAVRCRCCTPQNFLCPDVHIGAGASVGNACPERGEGGRVLWMAGRYRNKHRRTPLFLSKCRENDGDNPVRVREEFLIREPKHTNSHMVQVGGALGIVRPAFLGKVIWAVQFNRQSVFRAIEVHHVVAYTILTVEPVSAKTPAA